MVIIMVIHPRSAASRVTQRRPATRRRFGFLLRNVEAEGSVGAPRSLVTIRISIVRIIINITASITASM